MDNLLKKKEATIRKLIAARLENLSENREKVLSGTEEETTGTGKLLHELNTPLHAIFNAVELLKELHHDEETLRLANTIESAGLNLQNVISQFVNELPGRKMENNGKDSSISVEVNNILVVDDNDINARLAKNILENNGYRVDVVMNGKEAVEAAFDRIYDLILMDVQMPVMDGIEATRLLRLPENAEKLKKRPLIVAITANNTAEERKRCLDAGMDVFVAKPFNWSRLPDMISGLTESTKQENVKK